VPPKQLRFEVLFLSLSIMEFSDLIKCSQLENVLLISSQLKEPMVSSLCLTFSHIILCNREQNSELWLLHQNIDTIERKPYLVNQQLIDYNIPGKGHQLILKCKDLRTVTIEIGTASDFLNVASSIEQLRNIKDPEKMYAFFYRPMYSLLENGFTMFRY
jgi:myotubularin-related protein 9